MTEQVEIAIIGGGIVGNSIAHFLGGRRSALLLDQESALGYHSTGRSAAEFSYRFHSPLVGRLTAASADFLFTPPEGFTEVSLLKPRGNLIIANTSKKERLETVLAREIENSPSTVSSAVQALTVEETINKVPFLDPDYLAAAFYDPDCWDIEVESLLQGYAKSARHQGVQVWRDATVNSAVRENNRWRLETTKGEVLADTVVNAAGAWADPVAAMFGAIPLEFNPLRRTAITLHVEGYDVQHMPEVNEVDEDFYFKPDAGHLMVSPADETPVDPHDAWPDDMDIAIAADYMTQCTTLEIQRVAHSWAGLRTFAPDRIPVIGASSEIPGLFWAAGVGGFGIQTSPCVGKLAADLLCGDDPQTWTQELGSLAAAMHPARLKS